jgi:thymidylate kinase
MLLLERPQSSAQRLCSEILLSVCAALERAGIDWCIPHGYATYPEDVDPEDLDIVVRPEHVHEVPRVLARVPNTQLVQFRVHNGGTAVRYDVVAYTPERIPVVFAIDVSSDIRDLGVVLLGFEEFFAGRRRFKDLFWVPQPSIEFIHYLLKKLGKSALLGGDAVEAHHETWLSRLYREDPEGCRRQLARFFPTADAWLIAEAAEQLRWEAVRAQIGRLRRDAARKARLAHPGNLIRYWIGDLRRGIQRFLQPPGLVVAFLGLDGSGKSAAIDRTVDALRLLFASVKRYHIRPSSRSPQPGELMGIPPHSEPPRGLIPSLAKLALWWTDYWVGYLMNIVPRLFRPALVLFDRYYDDLLVDPQRYRFGGPLWLARVVGRCLPRPDVFVFLDAPPELARTRKPSVGLEQAIRQRDAYIALVRGLRGGHVVDAARRLDEVMLDVEEIILSHMRKRTTLRLRVATSASRGPVPSV